jgi:hypothetical protein
VIFGQFCTTADPLFVDETDYKLQRVLDGYQYDSPLVAGSQYYLNANSDFRDVGAWSYNESGATYKYQRTIDFPMPAAIAGSTIEFIRHNRSNLHVAEDGTPDTVNQPDARWEEIVMTFKTVGETYIDFIDWLEGPDVLQANIDRRMANVVGLGCGCSPQEDSSGWVGLVLTSVFSRHCVTRRKKHCHRGCRLL